MNVKMADEHYSNETAAEYRQRELSALQVHVRYSSVQSTLPVNLNICAAANLKPRNLLLQPLMLCQSDLFAVHWLSLYKHARIQRIATVSPQCLFNFPLKGGLFSDGADTTSLGRLFHDCYTQGEECQPSM